MIALECHDSPLYLNNLLVTLLSGQAGILVDLASGLAVCLFV